MAAINQRIPNFLGGVSQQPDTVKYPGQLRVCHNTQPDVTFGLKKRPPGEFIGKLTDATATGKWYSITGDKDEKFIMQITSENAVADSGKLPIKIWNQKTGEAVDIKFGKGIAGDYNSDNWNPQAAPSTTAANGAKNWLYLRGVDGTQEYGVQSIQDYTLISNPNTQVREDFLTASDNTEITNVNNQWKYGMTPNWYKDGHYAFISINSVAYNTEYAVLVSHAGSNASFNATNRWRAAGLKIVKSDNGHETWKYNGWTAGKPAESAEDDPGGSYAGQLGFEGDSGTSYTTPQWNSTDKKYNSSSTENAISNAGAFNSVRFVALVNGIPYLRDSLKTWENGDVQETRPSGEDNAFAGYKNLYDSRYNATVVLKDGGSLGDDKVGPGSGRSDSEWNGGSIQNGPNNTGCWVKINIRDQRYTVFIESKDQYQTYIGSDGIAAIKTPKNAEKGNLSLTDILEKLKIEIESEYDTKDSSLPDVGVDIVGNGLFIYSLEADKAINVQVRGGTADASMSTIGLNVQDIADLPQQCKDGYTVQVGNTESSQFDDYWLRFKADDGTGGVGRWVECAKPTRYINKFAHLATASRASGSEDIIVSWASNDHPFVSGQTIKVYKNDGSTHDINGVYIVKDAKYNDDAKKLTITQYDMFGEPVTSALTVSSADLAVIENKGMSRGFSPGTMPHALVAVRDNTVANNPIKHFTFIRLGGETGAKNALNLSSDEWKNHWKPREVGDPDTNPMPTFINKKISNLFFYRNRLGIIADEQIVLSQPGSYFNFFNTSALTTSDDNPIDISVSDNKPAFIKHVLPTQKGVMMFSPHSQFMFYSDNDVFSPTTARIKKLSGYETNTAVEPIDLGTTTLFTSADTAYSRAYEVQLVDNDVPPNIIELTRVCPEFIPRDITISANSPQVGMASFGKRGSGDIYHYKYYDTGEKREQSAWHSWTVPGNIQHMYYSNDILYTVTVQGTDYVLNRHEFVSDVTNTLTSYSLGTGTVGSPITTSRWFEACLDNSIVNTPLNMDYKRKGSSGDDAKTLVVKSPSHGFANDTPVTLIFTKRPSGFDVKHNEFTGSNRIANKTDDTFEVKFDSATTIDDVSTDYAGDQKGFVNNKHVSGYNSTGNTKITHIGFNPTQLESALGKPYLVALGGANTDGEDVTGRVIQADSVAMETIDGVSVGTATWNGIDLRGWSVAIGYRYTSEIELPNYYVAYGEGQYDVDADLRISGFNFNLGVSGPMEFKITSDLNDMDTYTQYESGMLIGSSDFTKPPSKLNKTIRVPVQKKNNKYKLRISIPDPFSTSIISGSWDGRYNTKRHVRK